MSEKDPSIERAVTILETAEGLEWEGNTFALVEDARDELNEWMNAHDGGGR